MILIRTTSMVLPSVIRTNWLHGFLGLVAFVILLPRCAPNQSVTCCSSARNVLLNKAWKGRQAQIMSSAFNAATQKEAILPVERTTMRLSILIDALLVFVAPAVAENW
jgi:hypothetical protein